MRYSEGVTTATKRQLKIDSLKGMDLRESDNISRGRSIINFIPEGSYLRKRRGFTEIQKFDQQIDCIGEVRLLGKSMTLIYSGGRFYLKSEGIQDITESATENGLKLEKLKGKRFEVFEYGDKNYIIGLGDYLVLGVWNNDIQLRRVIGSTDVYIPTTSHGISPKSSAVYIEDEGVDESTRGTRYVKENGEYREVTLDGTKESFSTDIIYYKKVSSEILSAVSLESSNLLTDYRINTLYGSTEGSSCYYLDSPIGRGEIKVYFKSVEGEVKDYLLSEEAQSYVTRGIEVGDDLAGKRICIPSERMGTKLVDLEKLSDTPIMYASDYMIKALAVTKKGKLDSYNITLIKENDNNFSPIVIANAKRLSRESYYITYNEMEYAFPSDTPIIIEEYNDYIGLNGEMTAEGLEGYTYSLKDEDGVVWGSLDHHNGELKLNKGIKLPDGELIKVLFRAENKGERNYITKCTFGQRFGYNGNSDRLFLSGNPDYPNYDFMSESNNPLYFPSDGISVFGDYASITGYARLSDNSQAILKEKQGRDCTVYIRRGGYTTNGINIGGENISQRSANFYLDGSFSADGCASPYSIGFLNGAPIFLSNNGIKTLKTSVNKANESRYTLDISLSIRELLKGVDLKKVSAVNYKDFYLLSVGDRVLVAKEGETFSSGQCEWWTLKGLDATCLAVIEGELYFGNSGGGLCRLNDGYTDYFIENLRSGHISLTPESQYVEISSKLKVELGSRIYLVGNLFKLKQSEVRRELDKLYVGDEIIYYVEGEKIYIDKSEVLGQEWDAEYEVREINTDEGTFSIYCDGKKIEPVNTVLYHLYTRVDSKSLYVTEKKSSVLPSSPDIITLSERENGNPIVFTSLKSALTFDRGYIITKKAVEAEWKSLDLNFGNSSRLKNIYGVSFDYSSNSKGSVELLCYSERAEQRLSYSNCAKYDLSIGSLYRFGFEGGLRKNCYLRCRLKGVTHARVVLLSNDGKEFEFKNLSIEYSFMGKNGGVN